MANALDVAALDRNGFVKIEQPELRAAADAARAVLWQQIGLAADDPGSWTEPVIWASDLTGAGPFGRLVGSAALAEVIDQVAGAGGWIPRGSLGNIAVRFPVPPTVDDRGWHIDANTPAPDGSWSVSGRPHTLLLLTLLSDIGPDDARRLVSASAPIAAWRGY